MAEPVAPGVGQNVGEQAIMKTGFFVPVLTGLGGRLALGGCGGGAEDDASAGDEPPAETVFDPLTQAPGRVQQSLDASREGHEQALEQQLEASEGAPAAGDAGNE